MFIKEDDLKLNEWQFSQRKFLPYEIKTKLAETRIREWYDNWNGQVYIRRNVCRVMSLEPEKWSKKEKTKKGQKCLVKA